MATATLYQHWIEALTNKEIDLFGPTDTFKVVLHSDDGVTATDDELADLTQVTGTGYAAGGEDTQNDATRSSGTVTMTCVDVVWTAGAGDWGTFRYVSIHDDTATGDVLMLEYDYGANVTLASSETFTVDFGASLYTIS